MGFSWIGGHTDTGLIPERDFNLCLNQTLLRGLPHPGDCGRRIDRHTLTDRETAPELGFRGRIPLLGGSLIPAEGLVGISGKVVPGRIGFRERTLGCEVSPFGGGNP